MKYGAPLLYTRGTNIVERNWPEAAALAAERTALHRRLAASAHGPLRSGPNGVAASRPIPT